MLTQQEKARRFRELHERKGSFMIPNPWDTASARLLASLGFEALATSSAASASVLGLSDGQLSRDEAILHTAVIAAATDLPVAADLESGYGEDPEAAAETIRRAAEVGAVGGSIEDYTGRAIDDLGRATERIAAAAAAARALPFPFTLTARAENFFRGHADLDDTIVRLQAYEKAGADVLFAPGLPDLAAVRAVCAAVTKPVHVLAGMKGRTFPVADLVAAGVKRISLATSLYRAAMSGLYEAAREAREHGTFSFVERVATWQELDALIRGSDPNRS